MLRDRPYGNDTVQGRIKEFFKLGLRNVQTDQQKKTEIKTWGGGGMPEKGRSKGISKLTRQAEKNKKLRGVIPYPLYDLFLASHKAISINIALSSITIFYITFKPKVVLFSLSSHLYLNGAPLWGTGIFYLIGNFFQWKGMMTDSSVQQNPSTHHTSKHMLIHVYRCSYTGHNLPDKSCVADTAMQIELA